MVITEPIIAPPIVPIIRIRVNVNVVEISERRDRIHIVIRTHEALVRPRSSAISNPNAPVTAKEIENLNDSDLSDILINSGFSFSLYATPK